MKIGIIGLGLIGGSLGLGLSRLKLIENISGMDISPANEKKALELGIVQKILPLEELLSSCDLLFIATPVDSIISLLPRLELAPKTLSIVELGSTKASTKSALPESLAAQTILAHPMAGTENSGPGAAFLGLYQNAVCVLCNTSVTAREHLDRAITLLSYLGMSIVFMHSKEHDEHVALISHLPHAMSFALANCVLKKEQRENILHLAGGSFRDMSRIAKSSPAMWTSIFKQNKKNLLEAIFGFEAEMAILKQLMSDEDWEGVAAWMKEANGLREIL